MDKRQRTNALVAMLFIIGLCIFLYPTASDWLAAQQAVSKIALYEKEVNALPQAYLDAEWIKAEDYNNSLRGDPVKDPFVPGSGAALPENYMEVLNTQGIMATIEIPKINVMLPVYHGTSDEVLQKAVGHMEGTALPIGDKGIHALLTGHTGLPTAKLFTDLIKLETGDKFYIHVLGRELVYQVDKIDVVEPTDISSLVAYDDNDYVTLITCTPYGINSHRLLVRGERVYQMDKTIGLYGEVTLEDKIIFCAAAIGALILVAILARRIYKRLRKNHAKAMADAPRRKTCKKRYRL